MNKNYHTNIFIIIFDASIRVVVEALRYTSLGRGFDTNWVLSIYIILPAALGPVV
jgi:hypothetical protein